MPDTTPEQGFNAGVEAAKKAIAKRRDDYVREHGSYDPSTGFTEFPGNGDEYVGELDEIEALIRSLHRPAPLPSVPGETAPAGDEGELNWSFIGWKRLVEAIITPRPRCRDCADNFGRCEHDKLPCDPTERALEAISSMRTENAKLRQIISDCAAALPNGAVCSPECSVDFMKHLPREIAACLARSGRGFIISNANEDRFRFWDAMGSTWTTNRAKALRFARHIDAERFCAEDEAAWKILEVGAPLPSVQGGE